MRSILDASSQLEARVLDMRLVFGEESRKGVWSEVAGLEKLPAAIEAVRMAVEHMESCLEAASARRVGKSGALV